MDTVTDFRAVSDIAIEARVATVTIPYNSIANVDGKFREELRSGALHWQDGEPTANVQHNRNRLLARHLHGLELRNTDAALIAEIDLPPTADGDTVATLLERRAYGGASVEMVVPRDGQTWTRQGAVPHRLITRARMVGLAIVDHPVYKASQATLRAAMANAPIVTFSGIRAPRTWEHF